MSRDGTSRPIENNGAPIRSTKGDISGVVLVFRDISERRERDGEQEKLLGQVEQERKRLEDIIASVPGVVWEAWGGPDETDQNINFVSDYVETMLGYTVEEWVNTPNFWLTIVHPDDKEEAAAAANETFQSGRTKPNRFRWITKDGRIIWVESYSTAIVDRNGVRLGMRGVTMNVNEQKQLEDWVRRNAEQLQLEYERLASLIDHINIGLVLVDKAGRYVLANNKWLEQTGYEREEVIGRAIKTSPPIPGATLQRQCCKRCSAPGRL